MPGDTDLQSCSVIKMVCLVPARNYTGETEEKFMKSWNELLAQKFHISQTVEGVFIDSWSQQPWNINDEDQQTAFKRETEKLWKFAYG